MTTEVLLIRHAEHDRLGRVLCGRMPGVTLNGVGRNSAATLAEWLHRQVRLDALYAGPLERVGETAAPIADVFGIGITVDRDFDELDFGAWSGLGFDELERQPLWPQWNLNRDHVRPPAGETFAEVQCRVVRGLERLCRRYPDSCVVVVSHADVIKAALAWALGLPLTLYARFEVSPASVSRLVIDDRSAKVLGINRTLEP